MIRPIAAQQLTSLAQAARPAASSAPGLTTASGPDFKTTLFEALDKVNRLQMEAGQRIEQLAAGESQNVAEVLWAVRKADIAFSLLMDMRNKLVDAYHELQQMRV